MMDDVISRQAAIDALNGEFIITGRENAETIQAYINGVDKKLLELPSAERRGRWIPVTERLPEIDNNLDGIRYLYPFLVTRYSSINTDRTKYDPYVAEHFFDGEDFLNLGGEVRSEYVIAWMPLPEPYKEGEQ